MYYELHGSGRPLVLLHGGVLTIDLTFGQILPALAKDRQVIAIELQGHGHTADTGRQMTLDNLADDVVALLGLLGIGRADFFGFSLGGMVSVTLQLRHPGVVGKLVLASVPSSLDGYHAEVRPGQFDPASPKMPTSADFAAMQDAYRRVAPDPEHFPEFLARASAVVGAFEGWTADQLRTIGAPVLLLIGDNDFVRIEHAAEMLEFIPDAQLAVLPAASHMDVMRRTDQVLALVVPFLDASA
jgi:pimeloyl-ACP methyl ester carboxylesterase